jgi:hypothetical protein
MIQLSPPLTKRHRLRLSMIQRVRSLSATRLQKARGWLRRIQKSWPRF